jgi:F-type H+-transporting ATPase subunit delta
MSTQTERVARRYAKALFSAATVKDMSKPLLEELEALGNLFQKKPALFDYFAQRLDTPAEQVAFAKKTLLQNALPLTERLLELLIESQRVSVLPEILEAYTALYRESQGIGKVLLVSAIPLTSALRSELVSTIQSVFSLSLLELETRVDPSILGGFTFYLNNKRYDFSLQSQLQQAQQSLSLATL